VLWLPRTNKAAMANLMREAERRGVPAGRLAFASYAPRAEDHLARLQLADLFLDTLPYNAHTTASDALWAGAPLVDMPRQELRWPWSRRVWFGPPDCQRMVVETLKA